MRVAGTAPSIWVSQATGTEVRPPVGHPRHLLLPAFRIGRWSPAGARAGAHPPPILVGDQPARGRRPLRARAGRRHQDRAARALRTPQAWESAVRLLPAGAASYDHGRPVGDVLVHGGADAVRRYSPAGEPLVDGLAALG